MNKITQDVRLAIIDEAASNYQWQLTLRHVTEAERVVLTQKLGETAAMRTEILKRGDRC